MTTTKPAKGRKASPRIRPDTATERAVMSLYVDSQDGRAALDAFLRDGDQRRVLSAEFCRWLAAVIRGDVKPKAKPRGKGRADYSADAVLRVAGRVKDDQARLVKAQPHAATIEDAIAKVATDYGLTPEYVRRCWLHYTGLQGRIDKGRERDKRNLADLLAGKGKPSA